MPDQEPGIFQVLNGSVLCGLSWRYYQHRSTVLHVNACNYQCISVSGGNGGELGSRKGLGGELGLR